MAQSQMSKPQNELQSDQGREELKERLKKGYSQMADLNLKLAQEGLLAEKEAYQRV
jgi:CopG family transcriptional regulator/antitoxin EndoAI